MPPGEAVEVLTARSDSVRNLAGAALWRLGRVLRGARRSTAAPVDHDGALWDAWHAEQRERHQAQADRRERLRAQADADRARLRAVREHAAAVEAVEAGLRRRELVDEQSPVTRRRALRARLAGIAGELPPAVVDERQALDEHPVTPWSGAERMAELRAQADAARERAAAREARPDAAPQDRAPLRERLAAIVQRRDRQ